MSGICGLVNLDGAPVDPAILRKMVEVVAYRGPDGIHYWFDGNVGLAHLALHTTPESLKEQQPLTSPDHRVCLIADARVDNRIELIRILTSKGFLSDRQPTDADLILAAYRCWGESCPAHIIGDFAFALWDARQRSLFCARDAVGARPFHHSKVGNVFCFASEAQQILQHPDVSPDLDELAIADMLTMNLPDESRSMFRHVHRLTPAHSLSVTGDRIRSAVYWEISLSARTVYPRDEDYAEHFLEIFSRVVADRLRTQHSPVGILLSGGIDSCSIAGVAQRLLKACGGAPHLTAYSFSFKHLAECDERFYTEVMAAELGIEIEYVDVEQIGLLGDPPGFGGSIEAPIWGYEPIMCEVMTRAKKRGARVLLTGSAGPYSRLGDSSVAYAYRFLRGQFGVLGELASLAPELELPYYRVLYMSLVSHLLPKRVDDFLRWLTRRQRTIPGLDWILPEFVRRTKLLRRSALPSKWLTFLNLSEHKNAPRCIRDRGGGSGLYYWDRYTTTCGMELRHPYMDRRLFEFLFSIPLEQVYRGSWKRLVIHRSMKGILPEVVRLRRHKSNYFPFVDSTLRNSAILPLPGNSLLCKLGIVDERRLAQAYREEGAQTRSRGAVWYATLLELWLRECESTFGQAIVSERSSSLWEKKPSGS